MKTASSVKKNSDTSWHFQVPGRQKVYLPDGQQGGVEKGGVGEGGQEEAEPEQEHS